MTQCTPTQHNNKGKKDSTKKLSNMINIFGKIAWYKINIQKSTVFLFTNSEQAEKEKRKTILFTIASTTTTTTKIPQE
jgi:hypothetical protein